MLGFAQSSHSLGDSGTLEGPQEELQMRVIMANHSEMELKFVNPNYNEHGVVSQNETPNYQLNTWHFDPEIESISDLDYLFAEMIVYTNCDVYIYAELLNHSDVQDNVILGTNTKGVRVYAQNKPVNGTYAPGYGENGFTEPDIAGLIATPEYKDTDEGIFRRDIRFGLIEFGDWKWYNSEQGDYKTLSYVITVGEI
jgi:hypothetical protein